MSAEVREAIATAANTVEGVTCTPYFTAATNAGTAHVRLDRIEYPDRFGGVAYWDLVLLLPQDLASAEQYIEAKGPALLEAVSPELVVERMTPQRLDITGVGVVPALFISGFREN